MTDQNKCNIRKSVRLIKRIVVHCSATREGKEFYMCDIDRWHRDEGWNGCGYHYVIDLDGKVEIGRDINIQGAHAGKYNPKSIGICYIGGLTADGETAKDTRTDEQKESLLWLLKELRMLYPQAEILGHRDLPGVKKACPCFNAKNEYKEL